MTHRRYVLRNGKLVELDLSTPPQPRRGPYVISDIGSYRSMVTGEMITSRSRHRDHLREHGCIEIGNEYPQPSPVEPLPPLRPEIERALQASPETHAEARAALDRATNAKV